MFPRYLVNFNLKSLKQEFSDFLIIGGGVAGLAAAIRIGSSKKVLILTKNKLKESNTQYAQGGIAIAIGAHDSPAFHLRDTLKAGDGLCSTSAVEILVKEGLLRVAELISWGARFDQNKDRPDLAKEGAHSQRRIIHAKGDATGEEVERILVKKAKENKNIKIKENLFVVDLLTKEGVSQGVLALNKERGEFSAFLSPVVILTTGGAGQLYKYTTNPEVANADGLAIAYRAGGALADLEFVQFHPTALYRPGAPSFLISESVRGEGGILKNANKERFMPHYHRLAELAPRDIVARAIIKEMKKTKKDYVFLDLTNFSASEAKTRFPTIYKTCLKYNLNLSQDLIPVAPAAHYIMGGVKTNIWGETNIPGLYAAGEVACSGAHGANRLASNSMLEGMVFGVRSAEKALSYKSTVHSLPGRRAFMPDTIVPKGTPTTSPSSPPYLVPSQPGRRAFIPDTIVPKGTPTTSPSSPPYLVPSQQSIYERERLSLSYQRRKESPRPQANQKVDCPKIGQKLQRIMWENVGIIRSRERLKEALKEVSKFDYILGLEFQDDKGLELQNMLTVSRLIIQSALKRKESRGAHFRLDYPQRDDNLWKKHIVVKRS